MILPSEVLPFLWVPLTLSSPKVLTDSSPDRLMAALKCLRTLHRPAGAKDPKALKALVESVHINLTTVNRDLTSYKGILSKLSAAKELMAELTQRERRKQAER